MSAMPKCSFRSWFAAPTLDDKEGCDSRKTRRPGRKTLQPSRLQSRWRHWASLEQLEDRRLLAAYVVTSMSDAGPGTLREALIAANANGNGVVDTISFAVAGTINLTSLLPALQTPATIDGTTAPGYAGAPVVEVNFGNVGTGQIGLHVTGGNSTLKGLAFNRSSGVGLWIASHGNVIEHSYIGTDLSGTIDRGNVFQGIFLNGNNNTIQNNLISGNDANGIWIHGGGNNGRSNFISNNRIGTNAAGTGALGNGINGMFLSDGARDNTMQGNTISANGNTGMWLLGSGVTNNRIQGNRIGTDVTGVLGRGNAATGVRVSDGANGNWIGTDGDGSQDAVEGNLISANGQAGIDIYGAGTSNNVVAGNILGLNMDADRLANGWEGVRIFSNASGNLIGSDKDGVSDSMECNIISGNTFAGVAIVSADSNRIVGNYIGTTSTGLASVGNSREGIYIASSQITVKGNTIGGNSIHGITLAGTGAWVAGNHIGLGVDGTTPLPNGGGIYVTGGANRIGTNSDGVNDLAERNVIGSNSSTGIWLDGPAAVDNIIQANYVGTDVSGTLARRHVYDGVAITNGAQRNTVGTDGDGVNDEFESNVISGSDRWGVAIYATSHHNIVAGNRIGTNAAGTQPIPNLIGVLLASNSTMNRIGTNGDETSDEFERNLVSGNSAFGVALRDSATSNNTIAGNYIGTDLSGQVALPNVRDGIDNWSNGNSFRSNVIAGNGGSGLVLLASDNVVTGNVIGLAADGETDLGHPAVGIYVTGARNQIGGPDAAYMNVISASSFSGIEIIGNGAFENRVQGNRIGTNRAGTQARGNGKLTQFLNTTGGVLIVDGAHSNLVGSDGDGMDDELEGNLISGNFTHGVHVWNSANNSVASNRIGTDFAGATALNNGGSGVRLVQAANNHVGSSTLAVSNVISGNTLNGIEIAGLQSTNNRIQGNYVGVDLLGTTAIPNGNFGVAISSVANGNFVGTDGDGTGDATEKNVISGNNQFGVAIFGAGTDNNVVAGNYIGTDAAGEQAIGNRNHGVWLAQGSRFNRIGTDSNGLSDSAERNVISGGVTEGITFFDSHDNLVAGNYIGLNASGTAALPNLWAGIAINGGSLRNVIGTNGDGVGDDVEGNTISGNGRAGIIVQGSSQNIIAGNKVGTDSSGSTVIANVDAGVFLRAASTNNRIGTNGDGISDTLETNLISGNGSHGVMLDGAGTTGNVVAGNVIGSDSSGNVAMPNFFAGVQIAGGASQNVIGTPLNGNRITFNRHAGVGVIATSNQNTIRGNSISNNGGIGIDLASDGPTLNDLNDIDTGPNDQLNFPTLRNIVPGAITRAVGTYQGLASSVFTLDFYANTQLDPSEYGEGARWLTSIEVTTDAAGNAAFDELLNAATLPTEFVTSTATDALGNTSEFSRALGLDLRNPTSRINPLPHVATSLSFPISVRGSDPADGEFPASGVALYDIYVSINRMPFSLWTTVSADAPSALFTADSKHTYGFRSIAHDWAGNIEDKRVRTEARITVPDLSPPNTQVVAVDSTSPTFQIRIEGTDSGKGGIRKFILYAQIDGGNIIEVRRLAAASPNAAGVYSVTTTYKAVADGFDHNYRFYTRGIDQQGNVEPPPPDNQDIFVTANFPAPSSLEISNFDVQRGADQRSFIRYVDVTFSTPEGVDELLNTMQDADASNDRVRLRRFETDGSGSGSVVPLAGRLSFNAIDQVLAIDFGAGGIGGVPSSIAGNGYYKLEFDLDDDGDFESVRSFYRLLGDTNGDRSVDARDIVSVSQAFRSAGQNLNQDVDGDGVVNVTDLTAVVRGIGTRINPKLRLDD